MRYQSVAHIVGWLFLVLAAAAVFPLLTALSGDPATTQRAFVIMILASGFTGGGLVLATRESGAIDMRREGLLIIAALWLLLPVWAAMPFVVSKSIDTLSGAYFEAVSGLTTTGATVFVEITGLPEAIILWRAELQWLGGLGTLMAWAVLVAPDMRSPQFDPSLAPTSLQTGTQWLPRSVFATIVPIYTLMTALCFAGLVASGLPGFDALCLAFATVSTGGFMPRDGSLVNYGAPGALYVVSLFMVAGGISLFWVRALLQRQFTTVRANPEPIWLITALVLLCFYLLLVSLDDSMNGTVASLFGAISVVLATASSHITTTGFNISEPMHTQLPLVLILALGFVGAGRYSTAGGVKFQRIGVMLIASMREFHHLVFPHSAIGSARSQPQRRLATEGAIWVNFFVVTGAVVVLALLMSTSGLNLTSSLLVSVSAIGNVGPAYDLAQSSDIAGRLGYDEMSPFAHLALAIGMVFGRFEVLALLSLFSLSYWRS